MAYLTMPYFEDEVTPAQQKAHAELCKRMERRVTSLGYCRADCGHRDCAEVRACRNTTCIICGKRFEAGDAYRQKTVGNLTDGMIIGIAHPDCCED